MPVDIVTALTALISAFVAFAVAKLHRKTNAINRDTDDISRAVNHNVAGSPRLYDLVRDNCADLRELIEWKRGYEGTGLDTGLKAANFAKQVQARLERIEQNQKDKLDSDSRG